MIVSIIGRQTFVRQIIYFFFCLKLQQYHHNVISEAWMWYIKHVCFRSVSTYVQLNGATIRISKLSTRRVKLPASSAHTQYTLWNIETYTKDFISYNLIYTTEVNLQVIFICPTNIFLFFSNKTLTRIINSHNIINNAIHLLFILFKSGNNVYNCSVTFEWCGYWRHCSFLSAINKT